MAYMRRGEGRRFFEGECSATIYPQPDGQIRIHQNEGLTEVDLAELSLRLLKRGDIPDEDFAEVLEVIVDEYGSDEINHKVKL